MGKAIMIVDDHQKLRNVVRDLLLEAMPDCKIIEAASGEEAVHLTETRTPDIVIMDIRLPGMDGIESARIMHDRKPELKIIMLSIQENDMHRKRARLGGASDYVSKREMHKDLLPAVKRALKETRKQGKGHKTK